MKEPRLLYGGPSPGRTTLPGRRRPEATFRLSCFLLGQVVS